MQALTFDASAIALWVGRLWWPALRVAGFVLTAPIVSEVTVPRPVKIAFTIALAVLVAPLATVPADLSILSGAGLLGAARELFVGAAIGMVVQLAFESLTFAGQTVASTMGLGFAMLVDPQRGANTPVLGQLFMTVGLLTYLALDGHLALIGALAHSFVTLPVGGDSVGRDMALAVVGWGGRILETGTLIALPAVVALVIVNLALGVVTRAAPQMNLFGIGFTLTLLAGFFVLVVGLDGIVQAARNLIDTALGAAAVLGGTTAAGTP